MELLIVCMQSLEEFLHISMLQANCFILTAVLFMDVNCGIFLAITLRIFMLPGRKQSDAYSIYHTIPTGGRLNKKDGLTRYGNSHVKDKTS